MWEALHFHTVMAGLDPAIHVLSRGSQGVDARDEPGHDEFGGASGILNRQRDPYMR
jgi:hypothetical protein